MAAMGPISMQHGVLAPRCYTIVMGVVFLAWVSEYSQMTYKFNCKALLGAVQ